MNKTDRLIFLIAPNVSEQMGGEAIKALQIFNEFKKLNRNTFQITHERCKTELAGRLRLNDVHYVRDTWIAEFFWRSFVFRPLHYVWFGVKAVKLAEQLAVMHGSANRTTVIHHTEPNSPVLIRKLSKICLNAIGPINGNIYYPKLFRRNETLAKFFRRKLHMPTQRVSALAFRRQKKAALVLAAGGERTVTSLVAAGYSRNVITETIDCGIKDEILDHPRITHDAPNFRFVHYGRLVFHKGTLLAIEGVRQTKQPVTLDIIGTGPELEACRRLVEKLHLGERVKFLSWFKSHQELLRSLRNYRGMFLPSLEDANGIVVQEALAIGLPPICLNWGGPQLLIEHGKSGFLIDPTNKVDIVSKLAEAMETLGCKPELAERMSIAGRARAEKWRWSKVADEWMASYPNAS